MARTPAKPKPDGEKLSKRAVGRPTIFSKEITDEICRRMICGETLLKICKDPKMPARPTVAMWLVDQREAYKEFHQAYARAREGLGDHMFEEAAEIADDGKADYKLTGRNGDVIAVDNEVVQRSRLRVDVRLKMAAHLNPARYGENKRMNDSDPDTTVKFLIEGGLPSA